MSHLEGALKWWDAGMSVVPVVADGSKRPLGSWIAYQIERADRARVERWFKTAPEQGVGIICGVVSGNLEMTEVEACRMGADFLETVNNHMYAQGVLDLWAELIETEGYCEATPSGGMHVLYRIADEQVPGNTKIAMSENGKITYAETRGEGGFVVVAPSSGRVHKTGDSWSVLAGQVGEVMTITWDQRCRIHAALKDALDERVLPVYERPAGAQAYDKSQGDRPGDAYNADPNVNVHDILTRNGWKYLGKMRGQDSYVHPNSSDMTTHSAVTGHNGSPNLYAWSGLPAQDYYTPFALLTHLEFNGDFSAAGKWLKTQGYGTSGEVLDISDWFTADDGKAEAVVETPAPAVAAPVENQAKKMTKRIEQFTEKGVGRFAGAVLQDRVRYVAQEKAWRIYDQGVWGRDYENKIHRLIGNVSDLVDRRVDEIMAKAEAASAAGEADGKDKLDEARKLRTFAKSIATNRGMKAVAEIASSTQGVGVSAASFDAASHLIAMENGTFNLRTMALEDHNADNMLTKRIGIAYDEKATAERWVKYLEEVIPDPEYRDYLQRAVGMALLGDTSEAAFFVLWGETGCGKSQFLEVINAAFGEYGVTAAASTFRESRGDDSRKSNSLHALRGARFVATSETSERAGLSAELVKRVTGGDSVKSHALYESEIEWRPQFTMFMGTNFRPTLDAGDGAIWRRVKPIQFPNSFFQDNRPTANREKGLADRIITTELAGVFNWIIEGVLAYRATGLKDPDSMTKAVREYREDSDPVLGFVNEAIAEGSLIARDGAEISMTDFYRMFSEWSRDNGIQRPMGKNKVGVRLEALGYVARKGSKGIRVRVGLEANPNRWLAGR